MKTLYSKRGGLIFTLISVIAFIISVQIIGINITWLSVMASIISMYICYKVDEGKSLMTCMLFIINAFYISMFCVVGIFIWCVLHSQY